MLNFIYGDPILLEKNFVELVKKIKKGSPLASVLVISPSNILSSYLKVLLLENNESFPTINIHFHSFYTFCEELLKDIYPPRSFISEDIFFHALIEKIITGNGDKYSLLKPIITTKAATETLFYVIRELKNNDLNYNDIVAAIDEKYITLSYENKYAKLREVLELYKEYNSMCINLGVCDVSDLLKVVGESLSSQINIHKKFKYIVFYGFYDFTLLQYEIIENLAKDIELDLCLYIPYEKNEDYRFLQPLFEELIGKAKVATHVSGKEENDSRNVSVEICNAGSIRDEIWYVSKEIISLVRSAKCRFSDILVTARNMEKYIDVIEEVFTENFIPFNTNVEFPMVKHMFIKTFLLLLQLKRNRFDSRDVLSLCKSYYFKHSVKFEKWYSLWRILLLSEGVRYDMDWEKLGKWCDTGYEIRREGDVEIEFPRECISVLYRLVNDLKLYFHKLESARSWYEFTAVVKEIVNQYLYFPAEGALEDSEEKILEFPEESKFYDKFVEIVESFAVLDKLGYPVSLEKYIELLIYAFSKETFPVRRHICRDGVYVLDISVARGRTFKVTFFLGLNEGEYPAIYVENPFVDDEMRVNINKLGYRLTTRDRQVESELFTFFLIKKLTLEKIYYLYLRADEKGRPLTPSMLLYSEFDNFYELERTSSIYKIPRGVSEKFTAERRNFVPTLREIALLYNFTSKRKKLINTKIFDKTVLDNFITRIASMNTFPQECLYFEGLYLTNFDGVIGEGYYNTTKITPSALNDYLSCPMRYMFKYVFGLIEPLLKESVGIEKLDEGSIYHKILQKFNDKISVMRQVDKDTIVRIINDVFKEYEEKHYIKYPTLYEIEKNIISEYVAKFINIDLSAVPGFEKMICEQKASNFIDSICVEGKMDRLIFTKEGELIIQDYKLKKRKIKNLNEILREKDYQLLMYFFIVIGLAKKFSMQSITAELYYIKETVEEGSPVKITLSQEEYFGKYHEQINSVIKNVVNSINSGFFGINPKNYFYCRHCGFSMICRRHHLPTLLRAAKDKRLEDLQESSKISA